MERQASSDEMDALRGRVAIEVDILRGAAEWCRHFAEGLSRHPSRPDVQNAMRVFQRTACDLDGKAMALEAAFDPPEEARGVAVVVGRSTG
jgi:hypothetical protein